MTTNIWNWLLGNPANFMVLLSLLVTLGIARAEWNGRRSGGSGWLTLARLASGLVFTLLTAIVAAFFGGVGAFFAYLFLQILTCIALPIWFVDYMPSRLASKR